MIGHSAYITGAERITRTRTAVNEQGEAQFVIGNPHDLARITGYWTVSDLVDLSDTFKNLALNLLIELQDLEHPAFDSAPDV